jgi:hypothetical protein
MHSCRRIVPVLVCLGSLYVGPSPTHATQEPAHQEGGPEINTGDPAGPPREGGPDINIADPAGPPEPCAMDARDMSHRAHIHYEVKKKTEPENPAMEAPALHYPEAKASTSKSQPRIVEDIKIKIIPVQQTADDSIILNANTRIGLVVVILLLLALAGIRFSRLSHRRKVPKK